MGRKFGFSFSAPRALGISSLKGSLARATGIPTTGAGIERKIGKMLVDGVIAGTTTAEHYAAAASIDEAAAPPAIAGASLTPMPVATGLLCSMCGLALLMGVIVLSVLGAWIR